MASRRFRITFALLLGIGLAIVLLALSDPRAVVDALRGADLRLVLLAACSYALFFALRGLRWSLLLRNVAPESTAPLAASLTAAGWMISTYVPMKAGDVTRTALLSHRTRSSLFGVAGSVAVERALDLMGLALAASVGLFYLTEDPVHRFSDPVIQEAVAFAWLLPIGGVLFLLLLARLIRDPAPKAWWKRFLIRFAQAADDLRTNPRRLPLIAALTVCISVSQVLVFVSLVSALAPYLPFGLIAAATPLFLLSFVVSVTPGNLGTYEASFAFVFFTITGVAPEVLLPIGFAAHVLSATLVTVLGVIGFTHYRLTAPDPAPQPAASEVPR